MKNEIFNKSNFERQMKNSKAWHKLYLYNNNIHCRGEAREGFSVNFAIFADARTAQRKVKWD